MGNNLKIPSKTAKQVIQVNKDQRAYWPIKTGLREKQVLQDPGYVEGVETTCCMLHGMLQGCTKYPMSKESKEIKIAIIQ